MKKAVVSLVLLLLAPSAVLSQDRNVFRILVKDHDTGNPIAEAVISAKDTAVAVKTSADGRASIPGIPDGVQVITIESLGYEPVKLTLSF